MFLHIGGSRVVAAEDIVGIFNYRIRDKQCNKEYLQTTKVRESNLTEEVKSFIVTTDSVSFSPIAPVTLKKRFGANIFDK